MPLYYDVARQTTTNASGNTSTTHIAGKTVANQETARITGLFARILNSSTVGSGVCRLRDNTGTVFSGGTSTTPSARNRRLTAAQTTFVNDATAITVGTTLLNRAVVGFAQTGGQNGWVAVEPAAAIQLGANATNPIDVEVDSLTTTGSQAIDIGLEFCEGT